jgi:hypothetical protein
LLRQRDSVNTDAIANLSDQVMKLMAEVNEMETKLIQGTAYFILNRD